MSGRMVIHEDNCVADTIKTLVRNHFYWPFRSRVYQALLILLVLLFLMLLVQHLHQPYRTSISFKEQLTERELTTLLLTLDVCTKALTSASIPFFMFSGTLLGSWRHHGPIPWDDDIDLAFRYDDQVPIFRVLSGQWPNYILNTDHPKRWKFYSASADTIPGKTWKFPFVDLNFVLFNETHIWDKDVESYPFSCFLRSEVFPLTQRPFQGRWLPAPKDTKAVLEKDYNLTMCSTMTFFHRKETGGHLVETTPCQTLMANVPFVQREALTGGGGCNETLVLNHTVLEWHAFPGQSC